MANYKTSRTEEDILRELTALLRELKDPRIDPLLTIVRVELSNDMSNCKVYVSSLSGIETAKPDFCGGNCFIASSCGNLRLCTSLQTIPLNTVQKSIRNCMTCI